MLLIDVSEIEIEVGQDGRPSITQGDQMLNDSGADRGCKLLYGANNRNVEPKDALP